MRGVPTPLDADIETAIGNASATGLHDLAAPGRPSVETEYVVKYTSAKYGGRYPPSPNATISMGLYVSPNPGFTWGDGLYVCPVAYPLSGAIYGRCGLVARLDHAPGWRIFNAVDPAIANLYVQWATMQPMYQMLTLTAHANWANRLLRNMFRTRFAIDVVVFPPDEYHASYTSRTDHRWLAVSEWSTAGELLSGVSSTRATDPRLAIVIAEEFEPTRSGIRRKTLIGPTAGLSSSIPSPADVIAAYRASTWKSVSA